MKKKKKNQKSNMLKEFKEFALKGNIIDMAIGVVIGGAFQKIVNSLVNDIIMPLISILIGKGRTPDGASAGRCDFESETI